MARPPILSIVILLLFSVFSYDALLGQLKRNGMVAAIDDIVSDPAPRFLPYSQPTYGVEGRLKTGEASIEGIHVLTLIFYAFYFFRNDGLWRLVTDPVQRKSSSKSNPRNKIRGPFYATTPASSNSITSSQR